MKKQEIIDALGLEPHLEGGYFRRSYQSAGEIQTPNGPRHRLTSIYYLLTDDAPVGHLHRNRSNILHYFHAGAPLRYTLIQPDGRLEQRIMGTEVSAGQTPQLIVEGGCWKASELIDGEFALISEAVSPGFDYADMELARAEAIRQRFPDLWEQVRHLIKA
ncbi:cupin domain-containing protein [Candidatus Endoriftia persephone]|uniref:Cupin family protein n=3 Tax=Gammaproteobacteria TaxID=1236 RepID=G2FBZ8_9GAMM|nr:cupin domain-containing protein [Candidatus Endoriftia persephone]EGV52044.1 cupin family protein [endosymbiont of Riftia pachyptila (vent Ph05)]EGW55829.1 cupin family protein [endosymbiont of Tevnia jerichonana (vent Tica)]USF86201.1 cupin domain-containing protein [Candidatus Endoriftia persephone]